MMKFGFQLLFLVVLCAACVSAFLPAPALFGRSGSCRSLTSPARSLGGLQINMVDITVQVNEGEPIESALRRFKV